MLEFQMCQIMTSAVRNWTVYESLQESMLFSTELIWETVSFHNAIQICRDIIK